MDRFEDIRPYNDSEVASVVANLLADDELVSTVANFKFLIPRFQMNIRSAVTEGFDDDQAHQFNNRRIGLRSLIVPYGFLHSGHGHDRHENRVITFCRRGP